MNAVRLIRLEWLKYRHSRLLSGSLIGFFVLLLGALFAFGQLNIQSTMGNQPQSLQLDNYISFPDIWEFAGYIGGNWIGFFIGGFLGTYLMTNEGELKMTRQQIISGLSRSELITAKILLYRNLAALFTILYLVSVLVVGLLYSADSIDSGIWTTALWMCLRFFVMMMFYLSIGGLIGLLIGRNTFSFLMFLLYGLFLEPIIRWAIHGRILPESLNRFYPMNSVEDLMRSPASKLMEASDLGTSYSMYLEPHSALLTAVIYLVVIIFSMFVLVRKKNY